MAKKTEEVKAPEAITGKKEHEFVTMEELKAAIQKLDDGNCEAFSHINHRLEKLEKPAAETPAEGFDELTLLKGRLLKLETQLGIKR